MVGSGARAAPPAEAHRRGRMLTRAARRPAVAWARAASTAWTPPPAPDPAAFPPGAVRTFALIAHVDHGKSTLADAIMRVAGVIPAGGRAQYLDRLQVERERGITVKAQAASLVHTPSAPAVEAAVAAVPEGERDALRASLARPHLVNLVDTPGHVDFHYEAERALAACTGAVLLVDAVQGPQARTAASVAAAAALGVPLVAALTKCDAPAADPARVTAELESLFGFDPESVLHTSGRTGQGAAEVLDAVVTRLPPPAADRASPFRALVFDAHNDDAYRGVVCLVALAGGSVGAGDAVSFCAGGGAGGGPAPPLVVASVGMLTPEPVTVPGGRLHAGQVGTITCHGLKDARAVRVGDTLRGARDASSTPLPGFRPAKAMLHAAVFPVAPADHGALAAALARLTLNDSSVAVRPTSSAALGAGFEVGFLGALHCEVFLQRLENEHGAAVLTSPPTVPFRVGAEDAPPLTSATDFPRTLPRGTPVYEPVVGATIVAPGGSAGAVMELAASRRAVQTGHAAAPGGAVALTYTLPLAELGTGFAAALAAATAGYASLDYDDRGEIARADVVRLDLAVNGTIVDALARIVPRASAAAAGRALTAKAAALLERQNFEVAVQAVADGRVVARDTLKAYRKNVTAKLYGGDVSRKKKLLEKQKAGKKRMRKLGCVDVGVDAFRALVGAA